jgi:hypothetical protein
MNQLDLFQALRHNGPQSTAETANFVYFNTTSKTGDDLKEARVRAGSETERILTFFRNHPNESFAPFEVEARLFPNFHPRHLNNTRRSITTLTPEFLTKTEEKRNDPVTGEGAFCWKLNR